MPAQKTKGRAAGQASVSFELPQFSSSFNNTRNRSGGVKARVFPLDG